MKVEQFLEVIIKGITLQRIQFFMLVKYLFTVLGEERSLLICITNKLIWTAAPEEEWNKLLINGMTVGKGEISPEEFYAVIKKRIERTLIRTVRQTFGLEFQSSDKFSSSHF